MKRWRSKDPLLGTVSRVWYEHSQKVRTVQVHLHAHNEKLELTTEDDVTAVQVGWWKPDNLGRAVLWTCPLEVVPPEKPS